MGSMICFVRSVSRAVMIRRAGGGGRGNVGPCGRRFWLVGMPTVTPKIVWEVRTCQSVEGLKRNGARRLTMVEIWRYEAINTDLSGRMRSPVFADSSMVSAMARRARGAKPV